MHTRAEKGAAGDGRLRLVVLISGRGSNLQALCEYLERDALPVHLAAVVSDNPKAAGLELARLRGAPTIVVERRARQQSDSEFNAALAAAVAQHSPDLIVLAGFMRILKPEFIRPFQGKIINIHPSLLPAFKGLHAQRQALQAGVAFAGCTVHFVTEEVDGGPIIGQAVVPVLQDDTEESLAARILKREHRLLPAVVRAFALGALELVEGSAGKSKVRFLKPLSGPADSEFMESLQP